MATIMKNNLNYNVIKEIIINDELTMKNCFLIFKWVDIALQDGLMENRARDILLRLIDKKNSLPHFTKQILNDFLEKVGFFPYVETDKTDMSTKMLLRYEFYRSENIPDIVMHQKQAEIYDTISNQKSVILSAPTSFGKSLLIEEIVASLMYKNIVIILPTLALIDETRLKMTKYTDKYKLIFSSKQNIASNNIFILTPERLMEIENIPKVDFFIIDEFYKLDSTKSEDERINVLNHAFYKLIKLTNKFYLLGPNISSIPAGFEKEYDCKFIPSDFTTVSCDEVFIEREKGREFEQLIELVQNFNDPTMIYCKSPKSAEIKVRDYLEKNQNNLTLTDEHTDAINWIKQNIHPDWLLIRALSYGIAFHHGAMPRHLGRYIVEEFNRGSIKYLFCTSTLIEGINTTAKNVVIFDNKKGTIPITYFDYRNIRGRAGRMTKHFLGKVYSFYTPPNDLEINVDFPWYTQDTASDEILIQVEDVDLKPESREKMQFFKDQDLLDVDVIKKNNNIPVKGQLELAEEIKKNIDHYNKLLSWTNYPSYEQLECCCNLIYNYLRFRRTRDEVFTGNQLAFLVNKYVQLNSNMANYIRYFINNDRKIDTVDKAVQKASNLSRKWFEFRFPKLLLALQQIQESVFKQHEKPYGDYKFYASLVESACCSPTLASLQEFGLPISLLKHLEPYLDLRTLEDEGDLDKLILQIKKLDVESLSLDPFEDKILNEFIKG